MYEKKQSRFTYLCLHGCGTKKNSGHTKGPIKQRFIIHTILEHGNLQLLQKCDSLVYVGCVVSLWAVLCDIVLWQFCIKQVCHPVRNSVVPVLCVSFVLQFCVAKSCLCILCWNVVSYTSNVCCNMSALCWSGVSCYSMKLECIIVS